MTKRRNDFLGCRCSESLRKQIKKEAKGKGITVSDYLKQIIMNRNNLARSTTPNKPLKVTVVSYYGGRTIETIESEFENYKEMFGDEEFITTKLISIEEVDSIPYD